MNTENGANHSARWPSYLLLVAVVLLWFMPWWWSGSVLAPFDIVSNLLAPWRGNALVPTAHNHFVSDAVTQYIPYALTLDHSFEADGYSGWNPMVFGGTAQYANTMTIGFDWSLMLYRVMGFWEAWHLGRMVQLLIAGFGMLVFLLSRRCDPGTATLAAVAYMGNWQFVAWIYHHWALASFCWMPWLLWALYRAREKSSRFIAMAAVFLGLALLGATLQHAAFIVITLGCVWMGWMIDGPAMISSSKLELCRSSEWRSRLVDSVLFVAAGLLAVGLVAYALEPTITGYLENLRAGHTREGVGYAFGWSQPLRMVLVWPLTFYPFVLGSVQTLDLTKAIVPSGVTCGFFGTVPMLLALLGLFSKRVPMAAKLLIIAGLLIPLTPLVGVLYQRVNILWILGGCWAAGVWLSTASEVSVRKVAAWCRRVLAVVLVLWTLASIALVVFQVPLDAWVVARAQAAAPSSQFAIFPEMVQMRASKLIDYLCVWNPWQLTALAGLALSLWGMARCRTESPWPGAALGVGVALQLSVFWWQWTTWSVPRDVYEQPELVRILQAEVGTTGRLAQGGGGAAEIPFPPNTLVPAGVAITGGYDSIHPDGMQSPTGKSWDFPGATHFLGSVDEDRPTGWQKVWSDGRWILLRHPAPAFGTVTLQSGGPVPLPPDAFKRGTLNTMEAVVPAGAVKLELFSNWHRGWKWRDDLQEQWRETSAGPVKGVEVVFDRPTRDTKAVYLQFDPTPPSWVLVVTGLSAMAVLALALFGGSRNERGAG